MKQYLFVLFFCLIGLTAWGTDTGDVTSEETSVTDYRRPHHSDKFYEKMLDAFCKENFHKTSEFKTIGNFKPVKYISLNVESVVWDDNHTDKVEGTVKFKYGYGLIPSDSVWFVAYVKKGRERNQFVIRFSRGGGIDNKNIHPAEEIYFTYDKNKYK